MGLFSRSGPPEAVRAALLLAPGERVVAWASGPPAVGGERVHVVATDRALHLPDGAGWRRVPWDLVHRAAWREGVLDVQTRDQPGARPRREVIELDDERDLPVVVRERVTASIEVQQHLVLPDGLGGVTAAARRVSDTGELRWSVAFDDGVDRADPAVRAAAARALAELRGALGL